MLPVRAGLGPIKTFPARAIPEMLRHAEHPKTVTTFRNRDPVPQPACLRWVLHYPHREDGFSGSGPACAALGWCGRRVGSLGPGLAFEPADAACGCPWR